MRRLQHARANWRLIRPAQAQAQAIPDVALREPHGRVVSAGGGAQAWASLRRPGETGSPVPSLEQLRALRASSAQPWSSTDVSDSLEAPARAPEVAPTALQRVERLQGLSSTLKELKATSARRQASALGGMPTQSRRAAVTHAVRTGGDYRLSKGKPQPEHAQYVFGIGTGRCGTVSLGKLLKGQPWSLVSHENRGDASNAGGYAPFWSPESPATLQQIAAARLQFMRGQVESRGRVLTGDVWSAHLPYVDTLLHMDRTIKIVALERNRSKVVTSFERHTNHSTATLSTNHWQKWQEGSPWKQDTVWDPFFPKFGVEAKSKAEAIGRYWDHYHVEIQRLVKQYPDNVRRYETLELLGHKAQHKQRELLTWLGIPPSNQKVFNVLHYNSGKQSPSALQRRAVSLRRPPGDTEGTTREQRRDGWLTRMQAQRAAPAAWRPISTGSTTAAQAGMTAVQQQQYDRLRAVAAQSERASRNRVTQYRLTHHAQPA